MGRGPRLGLLCALCAGWLAVVAPGAAVAQSFGTIESPVLTIDSETLYRGSAFGRRIQSEIEEASAVLAAENRRIEAELTAEERDLTERRPSLAAEEFRALADAFDRKVRDIRREQDGKIRALNRQQEEGRGLFLQAAAPVLEQMMRDAGAAVVLERRSVFISVNAVDITETAIAQIDAAIGDGTGIETPPEQ